MDYIVYGILQARKMEIQPMSDSEIIASIYFFLSTTFYVLTLDLLLVAQLVKNLPAVQGTQDPSLGHKDPLEKERANHSSIFAWKIPWTEEPSGLQSMGSQRVEYDWVTKSFTFKVGVIYVKLKWILFIKKYFWLKQFLIIKFLKFL